MIRDEMSECEETLGGRDEGEALRDLRLGVLRQEDALRAAEPPVWYGDSELATAGPRQPLHACMSAAA